MITSFSDSSNYPSVLYDDDYLNDEYEDPMTGFRERIVHRKRKHMKSETTPSVRIYVLYYILYQLVTNPSHWHAHRSKKSKASYQEFVTSIKNKIREKFYLERNPSLENDRYLKVNFKNKIILTARSMRDFTNSYARSHSYSYSCPEISEDNHILEYLLESPSIRTLYNSSHYDRCIGEYKKVYGKDKIYPVKRINMSHYLFFINYIKKSLL